MCSLHSLRSRAAKEHHSNRDGRRRSPEGAGRLQYQRRARRFRIPDYPSRCDADRDINVVFPIEVLRDLESEGFIGGIAKKHIGYMGYTMQLKAMYEGTAPEIANEIDRGSQADAVVLTGG